MIEQLDPEHAYLLHRSRILAQLRFWCGKKNVSIGEVLLVITGLHLVQAATNAQLMKICREVRTYPDPIDEGQRSVVDLHNDFVAGKFK